MKGKDIIIEKTRTIETRSLNKGTITIKKTVREILKFNKIFNRK